MGVDSIYTTGYNGWAALSFQSSGNYIRQSTASSINGYIVQVTSASVSSNKTVPTLQSYYTPHSANSDALSNSASDASDWSVHGPIVCGSGIYTFSGEITFELTYGVLDFVLNPMLFKRSTLFCMQFYNGSKTCTIYNCAWTSVTITGNPNSMVTVSISFQSNNAYNSGLMLSDTDFRSGHYYDASTFYVPYWKTGMSGVEEFTLTFSRSVSQQFLNNSCCTASYLRPSPTEVSFQATTPSTGMSEGELSIRIGSKTVVLLDSFLSSGTYNMSTMSDIGRRTFVCQGIRMDSSTKRLIRFLDESNSDSGSGD